MRLNLYQYIPSNILKTFVLRTVSSQRLEGEQLRAYFSPVKRLARTLNEHREFVMQLFARLLNIQALGRSIFLREARVRKTQPAGTNPITNCSN